LYYHRVRERDVRAAKLETQLANAQLSMLKMQLQPHFLFNTLHAVSALIRENPGKAEDMLEGLGDLLRLTLEQQVTQEVPLKTELDFIGRYLNLEQIRFADSLEVAVMAEPETLDALVPSMILQPLVENALRHGIAKRARGGVLEIRATRENDSLCLTVQDNGPGGAADTGGQHREGIGLANTRARLQQLYGAEQTFEMKSIPGIGMASTIYIPFRVDQESMPVLDHRFTQASIEELKSSA
jgi:LytS/YehU family sensor histidine kinase